MTDAMVVNAGPAWVPPWLSHLRRDERGLPVPFINRWGPEDPARYTIGDDATVRGPAVFCNDENDTVPDFTAQAPERQRLCMVYGLCQVCGRDLPWPRRYLVLSSISVHPIEVDGAKWTALTEPWLCQQCAILAIQHCPGLIRRKRAADLRLLHVDRPGCQFAMSQVRMDGPLAAESERLLPAMWVKVLLPPGVVEVRS